MANITLGQILHTASNQPLGMADNGDGTYSAKVQLNGSIELIKEFIGDTLLLNQASTKEYFGETASLVANEVMRIDISNYKDIGLIVSNAYDQAITITVRKITSSGNGLVADVETYYAINNVSHAALTTARYTSVDYPHLKDPGGYLLIEITTGATAPTSGSLSIKITGARI